MKKKRSTPPRPKKQMLLTDDPPRSSPRRSPRRAQPESPRRTSRRGKLSAEEDAELRRQMCTYAGDDPKWAATLGAAWGAAAPVMDPDDEVGGAVSERE